MSVRIYIPKEVGCSCRKKKEKRSFLFWYRKRVKLFKVKTVRCTMRYHHTPIRMHKIKILTILHAGEDAEQKTYHVGRKNRTPNLEHNLAVSYKVKHVWTLWPSCSTRVYSPMKNENLCSYRNLYTNVQTALIVIVTSKNNPKVFQQVNG